MTATISQPCEHDCGAEGCYDDGAEYRHHEHCPWCGGCGCPGYCDDYQTYNLRPAETGGHPGDGDDPQEVAT